jgi:hypothetical protein
MIGWRFCGPEDVALGIVIAIIVFLAIIIPNILDNRRK